MREISIATESGESAVLLGDATSLLAQKLAGVEAIIVADEAVLTLHRERLPSLRLITLPQGEQAKGLPVIERVYGELYAAGAERATWIVGVGGGAALDAAGFAAATYLRGLPFVAVPTSLLAQVDAAIGGKNGVNLAGRKNLVGTIRQPRYIISDVTFLETLPEAELLDGYAEAIKHAAIRSRDLFQLLERSAKSRRDPAVLEAVVAESCRIKAAIVTADEQEQGERRLLNFGHTLGHAVESALAIPHGRAIAIGMSCAAEISVKRGLLTPAELTRLRALLAAYELPTSVEAPTDLLYEALLSDKKRSQNVIHTALLRSLGTSTVEALTLEEWHRHLDDFLTGSYARP